MSEKPQLLSIEEAAEILGRSRWTVYRMVKRGVFKARWIGLGSRQVQRLRRRDVEHVAEYGHRPVATRGP